MNILKTSEYFSIAAIKKIEQTRNATYVCETCLKNKNGNWINAAVTIFYNKNPKDIPENGSAYFGLYFEYEDQNKTLMVTNAISAVGVEMHGVVAENNDVIYARYRHDYRTSPDKTAMVDGGRDYFRTGPVGKATVTLMIADGELKILAKD